MKKKILALVMSCALFASMLPSTVLASIAETDDAQTEDAVITTDETEDVVTSDKLSFDESSTYEIEIGTDIDAEILSDDIAAIEITDEDVIEEGAEIEGADEQAGEIEGDDEQPGDIEFYDELEADSDEEAEGDAEAEDEDAEEEDVAEDVSYMVETGGVIVEVTAPADALPDGAELVVERYANDSEEYKEAAEAIGHDLDDSNMAALDISFYYDGEEIEPTESVKVSIDVSQILPEDADASSIEVQHLVEIEDGEDVILDPVLVADDSDYTEGTIDEENAVAEFEVDSFSAFTVSWTLTGGPAAGTTYSLSVTAYLDGEELNDISGLTFSSENDELDFETLLSDVGYGTGDYTFSYAIVTVGNSTYGSQENPVVAIEIDQGTGGPTSTTNFLLVYADGTTGTVSTSSTVSVSAYYLTPDFSVSIEAVDEDESTEAWALQAVLSHAGSYESISYTWTVTDSDGSTSQYAKVTNTDNTGRAYIAWEDDTPDNTEVTVSVTVTLTLADGETKTATANYVLEYGDETVDLIMTYGPNKTALPAGVTVTLTSESGEHVYTGTTDSDGWVHDLVIEAGVYTVTATYTDDNGNVYQCSETVVFHDAGNYYINLNYYDEEILTSVPERSTWEHIDIKLSVGTTSNSDSGSVSVNITGAQIIGSDGSIKYTATEDTIEGNDNEFQLSFYVGDGSTGTADHSISFDTGDTITITYVLTIDGVEQSPSTITITADTTYDEGTTYPVTGQRAYKLYNYLYGTSYSSDAQLIADGIGDIDISGMSMMLVAAILCDSSEVTGAGQVQAVSGQSANQWGMDFALSIEALNELAASWAFNIEKTYENASMTAGDFVFYLYNATVEDGVWSLGGLQSTLTNQTAGMDWDGNSHDTMELFSIAYSDEAIQNGETYYYILYEQPDTVTSESGATITFDGTIFGVMVQLGTDADGEATVTATYYRMVQSGDGYTIVETYTTGSDVDGKITFDSDDYATFEFTNNYQNYTEISGSKTWVDYDNDYNTRPASITINLLVNGVQAYDDEGQPITATVTEADNWSWSFTDLPMYDGVTQLTYSIDEVSVEGYDTTITQNADGTYTITNTLKMTEAAIEVQKVLEGRDWTDGDSFTFTISADEGTPMPEVTTITITAENASEVDDETTIYTKAFDSILYTEAGTYTYTITENAGDIGGITYDSSEITVTVTVTEDEETGLLSATVSYGDDAEAAVFTNYYSESGTIALGVTKTVTGRSSTTKSFTFALYSADEDFVYSDDTLIDTESTTGTISENEAQSVVFDTSIIYNQAGTYYYVIKETTTSGNGWTCDGTEYHVTVTVASAGSGNLNITEVAYSYVDSEGENYDGTLTAGEDGVYGISGDNTLNFTNSYHDADGDVIFGGTKSISGMDSTTATFTFGLYETDSDFIVSDDSEVHGTTIVGVEGEKDYAFEDIYYTETGTYYYVVKETATNGSGWSIDSNEYHITVVVTDEGDEGEGTYTITVSCVDSNNQTVELTQSDTNGVYTFTGLDFTNTYDAEGNVTLTATKEYEGADLTAGQFSFTITETTQGASYTETVTNDAEGNITFTAIDYTLEDVGEHTYEIVETKGTAGGVTYDESTITVTVVVEDNGDGTLSTKVTVGDNEIEAAAGSYNVGTFSNSYNATGDVTLVATKKYEGADLTAGQFSFTITETTQGASYTETVTNDADGSITFSKIEYTLADVGTHTYEITETSGNAGGVSYDSKTITVTVVVEDNSDGTLSMTVTVGENKIEATDGSYDVGTFNNTYEASGDVTLKATKKYEGADLTEGLFSFTIRETTQGATYTETVTNDAEGNVTFTAIEYTLEDVGTHTYEISETKGEAGGVTYDESKITVTVVVSDNGDGTLETVVSVDGPSISVEGDSYNVGTFENSYEAAETSVQFTGTKYITNSTSTEKVFTFELYTTDESFSIDGLTPEQTSTEDEITNEGQSFQFGKITYTETGTHYYVIQEKALDADEGWTIDSKVYNITVKVTDNGEGQLVAAVTVNDETVSGTNDVYGGFDFANEYAAEGDVTLGVVKSISGVASTDKTFSFTLFSSDEAFTIGDSIETIATNGEFTNSTEINFTAIPYEAAGTYYYVITETGTAPDGWTLDTKEYHVTVTATDNGDGTITTSASYEYVDENEETQKENSAAFTNTYKASGELTLTGSKNLVGGTLEEDGFTFTMTDSSTGESVGEVTMDSEGIITFPKLTYDETDIGGEYTYTINETNDNDSSVVYDDTTYTVVVSVADNGDGTLDVTYTVNDEENGDITFTNYQKGSLSISKTFTGLTEDQIASLTDFTITVTNSDGDTVATLTLVDADEGSSYTWTISDLVADTYTVTESGYSIDGYEVIAKSGEVELKTDGTDASMNDELDWGDEDTVAFTNDYTEVGTITISKYVVAEEDIQEAHEDTEYTVVITASEDADFQWVTVTSNSGREITPTIEGKTITFTITEDETVTISGLPAGVYTVEETGSDAVTSESFVPVYKVKDEETEGVPTVTVASGNENVVAVVIENEYPIGTYIMVQKDYNKDEYPEEGFTFTIEALSCDLEAEDVTLTADEMPMPDSTTVTITESGEIGYFGNIEYEHLGTYYYKITETAGSEENVDYDTSVHYIMVVVDATDGTYVETVDEWEAKADAETDNYKDLEYKEAGIVTAEFTNTAYEKLTIEKEVAGDAGDTSEYEFEITLTKDGTGYDGDIETTDDADDESDSSVTTRIVDLFTGVVKVFADDSTGAITFTEGKGTVTVKAGESVTLLIPSGWDVTVTETTTGADSTTVYDGDGNVIVQVKGTTSEATAELGTIADSTQVKFVNSYRAYYPIDEEIVTDTDDIFDKDAWVKDEAVNEYNAIEIEMTTNLPVVTAYDLENGAFTMNFHEVLDHELVLDEDTADFSVYIAGYEISSVFYRITFDEDTGDDCNFHVDVDLTALYNAGVVTEDMLDGNTEITIFFFADLEGTGLNGSYKSTIWYDIYDGDEWLYTSNESVVEVYTYEIEILKYDEDTGDALAGATLGVYYDEDCTNPVSRNGEAYTATSGDDGMVIFYGLADGTYYVKETEAPSGYVLSDEVLTVELGEALNDNDYTYEGDYANTPEPEDEPEPTPDDAMQVTVIKVWEGDDESDRPDSVNITLLKSGEVCDTVTLSEANDWRYTWTDLEMESYAVKEETVPTPYMVSYLDEWYKVGDNAYQMIVTNTFNEELITGPGPASGGNPDTGTPDKTTPSSTADADLPVLPIAGCFAAIAMIAGVLVYRRKRSI